MKSTAVILAGALVLSTAGTPLSAESMSETGIGQQVVSHPVPDGDGIRNIRKDRFPMASRIDRERMAAVLALLLIGQVPRDSASLSVQPTGLAGR